MSLYDSNGSRKYLSDAELKRFMKAANKHEREVRTFCHLLAYTGCRVSEALALTADRIDLDSNLVVFQSLKKRRDDVYRAVPVPQELIDALCLTHGLVKAQRRKDGGRSIKLWSWSRITAWRRVKQVMVDAKIKDGANQTARGLRHSFGVSAVTHGIPLNMTQKWMGHAQISTTSLYADAVGEEEHKIASRMWK